jgi:hypothetical protein
VTIPRAATFIIVLFFVAHPSLAADSHAVATPSHATTAAGDAHAPAANQPVLPPAGIRWPAVMLIITFGMFLAAMIVGPVVRLNMPEEVPVTHAHDESHGHGHAHDHGHGHAHGGHH